ncbi:MAG: alpha/beta hydrolase [Sphingomonas bacterium]|nr:alpha/beta hydrolase [Sphingomonas bacterium]
MTLFALAAAATLAAAELSIPGPKGPLAATLTDPGRRAPAIILIPGSGPTDRNGDNPLGVSGGIYRQLATQLAAQRVATLRIDKRGMFASKAAIANGNDVTIAAYAADVRGWARLLRQRGKPCAWLAGHSEGGLVALAAAQNPKMICGLILLAAPGRRLGAVLREQLKSLPAAKFGLADAAIAKLERRQRVDPASVPPELRPVFNPAVQGYMIDLLSIDPAALAARTRLPMIVIQGDADLQVTVADARALAAAHRGARLVILPNVNHVWKSATAGDRVGNLATYGNPALAIDPAVATTIARFVKPRR